MNEGANGLAMSLRKPGNRPPVTDEHRRAALAGMGWSGWTLERALADAVRSRILESRAAQLRDREWRVAQGMPVEPAMPTTAGPRVW